MFIYFLLVQNQSFYKAKTEVLLQRFLLHLYIGVLTLTTDKR